MSHTPPIPGTAQSPYPLQAPQVADRADAKHDLAERAAANLKADAAAPDTGRSWPRFAAGAAIGSAAIAAGLLFYNRSKS